MIIKSIFKFLVALILWSLALVARLIWLSVPIGIHMLFLQLRTKADTLPALTGYFDPNSTWQMIYDGAVLVNTNPGALSKRANNVKNWFINTQWYWLILTVVLVAALLACIAYKLH